MYRRDGIQDASGHSTRRTFITNLAAQGILARVPASLAGHVSIVTTRGGAAKNLDWFTLQVRWVTIGSAPTESALIACQADTR